MRVGVGRGRGVFVKGCMGCCPVSSCCCVWSLSMDGWAEVFCPAVSDTAWMVVIHGWSLSIDG